MSKYQWGVCNQARCTLFGWETFSIVPFIQLSVLLKVAYTSGPIFEKIMKRYPIFSVQIIDYQIDQKQK